MLAAGLNVVENSHFWRSIKPFARGAMHFRPASAPYWVIYLRQVARALSMTYVDPMWKKAAIEAGYLRELSRSAAALPPPPPPSVSPLAPQMEASSQSDGRVAPTWAASRSAQGRHADSTTTAASR